MIEALVLLLHLPVYVKLIIHCLNTQPFKVTPRVLAFKLAQLLFQDVLWANKEGLTNYLALARSRLSMFGHPKSCELLK